MAFNFDTSGFFDSGLVDKSLDKPVRDVMSRFGAHTRRDARQSLRRARRIRQNELSPERLAEYKFRVKIHKANGWKRPQLPYVPSAPGEPPRTRGKSFLKRIFFSYDKDSRSVIVGPSGAVGKSRGKTTNVLEHGGTDTFTFTIRPKRRLPPVRKGRKALPVVPKARLKGKRRKARRVTRNVTIERRAFMNPAFNKNAGLLAQWRASLGY